jgi:uncharacterized membrane protein
VPIGGSLLPSWIAALLFVGLIVGVVVVYWKDARALGWPARTGLILLRFCTLAVVLLMLCQFTLSVTRTGLPTLALLIDTSASMGLDDRYRDTPSAKSAKQLQAAVGADSAVRLTLAQSLLIRNNGDFLKKLAETYRLKLYEFSSSASEVPLPSSQQTDDDLTPLIDGIRALRPTGSETRPAVAVRHVLDDLRGSPPTAVVVLTDGISTTGPDDRLSVAAEDARDRSVPLFPIGFGSNEPSIDLQLGNVLADDVVFADDPLTFAFQLKAYGFAGKSARVTLRRQGHAKILQSTEVDFDAEGQSVSAELTHVPDSEGEFDFIVEAETLPGETNTQNNSVVRRVQVREEELRVLLVEWLPRWEYRHLKPLLERDPTVELHTVLQQADVGYSNDDRTALSRFPVDREVLMEYDVLILGDVDLTYLGPGTIDSVRAFVAERGGGLVMIAGARHNPHSYRETLLEDLLPVEIHGSYDPSSLPAESSPLGFRPKLTVEGRTRAALRLADTAEENERLWDRLPQLFWIHESGRRKPATQVLAVHPTRHSEGGPLPVIAIQRFGAGQVLFHATDELWQWRQRVEDRHYGRYWLQMIRYLSRSKLRSNAQGIELAVDRSLYEQGDTVEITARFLDVRTTPVTNAGIEAVIEGPSGFRESVDLTRRRGAPDLFVGRISGLVAGSYHAWLSESASTTTDGVEQASPPAEVPSTDFRVEISEGEIRDRVFQRTELAAAAKRSHGSDYGFWEADRLLEEIPHGRAVPISNEILFPLWNRWESLVLLALLLASEWIFRKRSGLI